MRTLALGLAGVLMIGASVKAEEPTPLDKRTFILEARTFILEAENGQLRLKPKGVEKVLGALPISVALQRVTIESGPDNTVVLYLDPGEGKSSKFKYSTSRTLLIIPENPDQADSSPKPTTVTTVGKAIYDPVIDTLTQEAAKQQQIEHRLTEVEQKLELILKELKDLKGR